MPYAAAWHRWGSVTATASRCCCSNSRHFVITYFATLGLGAVAVPLNPLSPPPAVESEIATVAAKVVVIEKVSAVHVEQGRSGERPVGDRRSSSCDPNASTVEGAVPLAEPARRRPVPRVDVDPDHLATLMFTSGTAGMPRAAMLTHGNLLRQHRAEPQHRGPHQRGRRHLHGAAPVPHLRTERGAHDRVCSSAPRSCWSSDSIPPPPSRPSPNATSPCSPGRRRCGRRSRTSTSSTAASSPRSGSRCRALRSSPISTVAADRATVSG